MKKVRKEEILKQLKTVIDPELNISIVDMGLIYDVEMNKEGLITVTMTLTTVGCPLFDVIAEDIVITLKRLPGVEDVKINLTFDPPWTPDKMSDRAKAELGWE